MHATVHLPFHSLSLLLVALTAALVYTQYSVAHTDVSTHSARQTVQGIYRHTQTLPHKTTETPVQPAQNEYAFGPQIVKPF